MMARTHIAFGILACAGLYPLFSRYVGADPFLFYTLVLIGVLLPDIDHQESSINRLMPVTNILPHLFKHRGFFHSVFPALIIIAIFFAFSDVRYGLFLAVGYVTHLGSDALTKMGVNFLYPITSIKLRGPVTTGTKAEALAGACALAVAVVLWTI